MSPHARLWDAVCDIWASCDAHIQLPCILQIRVISLWLSVSNCRASVSLAPPLPLPLLPPLSLSFSFAPSPSLIYCLCCVRCLWVGGKEKRDFAPKYERPSYLGRPSTPPHPPSKHLNTQKHFVCTFSSPSWIFFGDFDLFFWEDLLGLFSTFFWVGYSVGIQRLKTWVQVPHIDVDTYQGDIYRDTYHSSPTKSDVDTLDQEETWGAGVDIHTVDTRPPFFQFRTYSLVRFAPNNHRYHALIKWYLITCNTGTLYQ